MAIVKVIEQPRVVWSEVTYQGKVTVDGKEVEFRFMENDKRTDFYIWDGERWKEVWPEEGDIYNVVYEACMETNPEDWDSEWDSEDREDYL